MSSRYKEQTKALKGPDQFQVRVMSGMDWAVKHTKQIVLVAAPIALSVVGYFVYKKVMVSQRDTRLEELGKVQVVYEGEERTANDQRKEIQKKIDEIEKKLTPPPPAKPGVEPAAVPDSAKLTAEKTELEKQAGAIKADHGSSSKLFLDYFKKFDTKPEGWMAGMTAARVLLDQQKVAEATPVLVTIVKNSKDFPFYQMQARLLLISVYEEQGLYDEGLAELDQLDKVVDKDLKPRVLLAKGRIQMLKDKKDDAKATFNSLIENHGTSPEAQKARSIQSLLN